MTRVYVNGKSYIKKKTFSKRHMSEREKQWDDYFKCVAKCAKQDWKELCALGCAREHLKRVPRV